MIKFLAFLAAMASTAAFSAPKKDLWIYTSIYKEYATPLADAFAARHPEYSVQVFQGGSEKIQAKVEAELVAGRPLADIMLVSDPFWGQGLEHRKLAGPQVTNYYSVMVLICHKDLPVAKWPASFQDLTRPEFDRQVQFGSPLESGTTFSTVALLSRKYGWEYFEKLKANHLASSGGNSTVIQKVESGERKIGVVLLENALASRKKGSPIEIIYPSDGSIPIPSVQIRMMNSPNGEGAEKFAEFVLSTEGQKILRSGYMYSVRKDVAPPEGAPSFTAISKKSQDWNPQLISEISSQSKEIKRKFASLILE
jgi:iron(III) transport system substrate-binding protein